MKIVYLVNLGLNVEAKRMFVQGNISDSSLPPMGM